MLPRNHRFLILNQTGQTLDFSSNSANESATVTRRPWKIASGARTDGSEASQAAATDLTDGSAETLGNIDNSSDKNFGLHGTFEVETDNASVDGDVHLLMEHSTDGGTSWPSDAADFDPETDAVHLATLNFTGAATKETSFTVN